MSQPLVRASSQPLSEGDTRKRELAWKVLSTANQPVVDFAKLMVPTALSAVGAIVGLAKLGKDVSAALVAGACVLSLLSMVLFAWVVYARPIRVSAEDYDDVLAELLAAAAMRHRVATLALLSLTLGVVIAIAAFLP